MEPRDKLYVAREASFPSPLKKNRRDHSYEYIVGCNPGENIDEYWNVDGDRELSDTWTSSTWFTILDEQPLDGHTWSGETDKKGNDTQT